MFEASSTHRNKQNLTKPDPHIKPTPTLTLTQGTLANLKQQISSLQLDKHSLQRQYIDDVDLLKLELGQYKKKLSVLTDKYLLQTFAKERNSTSSNSKDYDLLLREKDILFQYERESKRKVEETLKMAIQETVEVRKEVQRLRLEKEKSMEIGLVEKIELEEKNALLQEEVNSKKNIVKMLKKQLEKSHGYQEHLNKQERSLTQKSKELDHFSQEINEYNRLNELKMKQQLSQLGKENQFLKDYVKKIEKMAKKECQCELKDEKVRDNLFQIKRELALAKVKLGQHYFSSAQNKKGSSADSSDAENNYSFTLS